MNSDYITVLTTATPCNKQFSFDDKTGKVVKQSAPPISNAYAQTIAVPDLGKMKWIIEQVGSKANQVIVLGFIPGTEAMKGYRVMGKAAMANEGIKEGAVHEELATYSRTKGNFVSSTIVPMDYDLPKTDNGLAYESFEQVDTELYRRLNDKGVGFLRVASNSGRVRVNGEPYGMDGNNAFACHYYIKIDRAQNVPEMARVFKSSKKAGDTFSYIIKTQYVRKGTGEITEGAAISSTFDYSVISPERVVYEGKPLADEEAWELSVADVGVVQVEGCDYSVDALVAAERGEWTYGDGHGWFDNVRDDITSMLLAERTGDGSAGRGANGVGAGGRAIRTLPNDTMFETKDYGPMTFEDYALSGHGKLRCQSLREGSDSWAAFLDRSNESGKPQHYDTIDEIQYMASEPLSLLQEGFDDEEVSSEPLDDFEEPDAPGVAVEVDEEDGVYEPSLAIYAKLETGIAGNKIALDLLKQISGATSIGELRGSVALNISRASGISIEISDLLIEGLICKYAELSDGLHLSKPAAKEWIKPVAIEVKDKAQPKWCDNWVYLSAEGKYLNINTGVRMGAGGFNVINTKRVAFNEYGSKPDASKWTNIYGYIKSCGLEVYLPRYPQGIVTDIFNRKVINTYFEGMVPVATKTTDDYAVEVIKRHIRMVFDDNEHIFTSWLAHQVQSPGVLLRWAPLIASFEGVGKTTFADLLGSVMGHSNVSVVSATEIKSDFTGWAQGSAVAVMEEVRVSGQNRHDISISIKDKITNDRVSIIRKGQDAVTIENVTNYILFTNAFDAIPVTIGDRRWWVIRVKLNNGDEMKEYIKSNFDMTTQEYFTELHRVIRTYPCELRKWFLDYELAAEFTMAGIAPKTDDKLQMIEGEYAKHPGYESIVDVLEMGYRNVAPDVVVQKEFILHVIGREVEMNERISGIQIGRTMAFLGWTKREVRTDKIKTRYLIKKEMSNDEIRLKIEAHNLAIDKDDFPPTDDVVKH